MNHIFVRENNGTARVSGLSLSSFSVISSLDVHSEKIVTFSLSRLDIDMLDLRQRIRICTYNAEAHVNYRFTGFFINFHFMFMLF